MTRKGYDGATHCEACGEKFEDTSGVPGYCDCADEGLDAYQKVQRENGK